MPHVRSLRSIIPAAAAALLLAAGGLALAQTTTASTLVDATDLAKIGENVGKEVLLEGVVSKAEWSRSGKVMNVEFKGVDRSKFVAVAFEKGKDRLNASFMGDAAKTFTGSKLRIRGTISKYNGPVEAMKDLLQIVISDPSQVTVVEPATGATPAN